MSGEDRRPCWKCGHPLAVESIRWGRDTAATPWFVHVSTTRTPVCPS